jgi:tetratricopeptide (TPR) repeat protein
MRRLALLAVLLGMCGCGSRTGQPTNEQTADPMPIGDVTRAEPATSATSSKSSSASYLGPHDSSFTNLPADEKSRLQEAEKLMRAGQFGVAVQTLSNLIGENPKNSLAFVLRGQANAERKNDADAAADFSTAVQLEPQNPERLSARGFFRLSRGSTVDALSDFNRAIELDPKNARAHNNRGMARLTSGEVKQSIEDFDACIQLDPNFVPAYNNRSFAYAKSDRRQDALADLDKALELDPNVAGTYDNRGSMLLAAQEPQKALADFTRAIQLDPANPNYYAHRRVTLTKLEKFAEAQADAIKIEHLVQLSALNEAVFRDRKSAQPYIDRGIYFLGENQIENALANFTKALELKPKNANALTQRSRAWLRHGDLEKAVNDATAALAIDPREETYGVRGDAYRKLKEYDKALADYDAAQRIDQDVAETWTLYAQSLQQAGRSREAEDALRHAADLKALNAPTRLTSATAKPRS